MIFNFVKNEALKARFGLTPCPFCQLAAYWHGMRWSARGVRFSKMLKSTFLRHELQSALLDLPMKVFYILPIEQIS
jgi:hypothetical protein